MRLETIARSLIRRLPADVLSMAPLMGASINGDTLALRPSGSWTALYGSTIEAFFNTANEKLTSAKHVAIDMSEVSDLDTVGAWIFEKLSRRDLPPLKWSSLKYIFWMEELIDGKEEAYS